MQERGFRKVIIVADQHTYQAAGVVLSEHLMQSNIHHHLCLVNANDQGDVVADEPSVVQVFLNTTHDTDAFLAVGAGTIHDIVRFVSYKMNKPFISVPTAASVDGFTSAGAPLIIRGMKQTVQAASPIAVFADLDVLCSAPRHLTAAGFGDMVAKYISLFDWRFSHIMANEPYCCVAADWTRESLESCIRHIDDIQAMNPAGIQVLMEALLKSGLAMLLVGHSRSASGAEHHLSHYWEMDFLKNGRAQVLHGAKVGVTTIATRFSTGKFRLAAS
ncbi:sn-glycerol-1-phosphate dehydrogenase [Ammoniphilus sp. 3BR4]|uniref:sn-glycerol-1-phosphate dehydrogenase n=1 Tax=Ammoniphilus sp. 3BR4 TaxID=3158265 RepID=UPI003465A052